MVPHDDGKVAMRFGEIERDQLQNVRRPSNRREKRVRHFIDWVSKRIGLKDADIDIAFSYDKADAQDQHRTGQFDWHNKKMLVYVGNRNMVDILRTVCHELQHVKQNEDGRIKKYTGPGSPLEVEADAVAGYLMKLYGKLYRDIFE